MPTIEVSYKDMCNLIGKKLTVEELKDAILYAKGEVDAVDGDVLKVDMKDTNRPDLWSAEGIAREIRGRLTRNTDLPKYSVKKSKIVVKVDKKVSKIRPYTVCAVVRNLKITPEILSQTIQLQEKVAGTFGRNRKEVAIGVYDLHKIKSPIKYTTVKPNGIKFVPLEFEKEMTPREILREHPKGKEFGHLLADCSEYPIFMDSAGNVLSMPPIINSDYTGKVTEETRDVFVEATGFNLKFLVPAVNVIVAALADRGGRIESVRIVYPNKKMNTPDLTPKKAIVDIDYVNKISGLGLSEKEICRLLEQARYKTKLRGNKIEVLYPAYRQDIMHQRDVVEDVIISYGINRIEPVSPRIATVGSTNKLEIFSNTVAEIMVGLGLQEILSYNLTNKKNLFDRMNLKEEGVAEIENVVSQNWCVFRSWSLPSLLEFLSLNKHVEYPQRIFEIGNCVVLDDTKETKTRDERKLAVALTDNKVSYDEISSVVDALFKNLGVEYKLRQTRHSSFIDGRVAEILVNENRIGIVGEIHPKVLNNWELEMPVVAFEINLEELKYDNF